MRTWTPRFRDYVARLHNLRDELPKGPRRDRVKLILLALSYGSPIPTIRVRIKLAVEAERQNSSTAPGKIPLH
jgi:hypothetical protein